MDLPFQIDQESGIPIYIQIRDQIKHLIATGILESGDQLPTIREMAVQLTVNLHTVAHAYAELEREKVLTVKRGRGTFVANGQHDEKLEVMRKKTLQSLIDQMFVEALNLGYEQEEVKVALEKYID